MGKLDLKEKLEKRQGKPTNKFIYKLLFPFIAVPQAKPMNLEVVDNVGFKDLKGQFVLISNHTSRCDWEYIAMATRPHVSNFMASYIEFNRSHMHFIFDLLHVIPKKNFVTDTHSIKELLQVVKKGGNIVFFPEGKSSISGTNQPVMMGTAKLLKHLGLPVYSSTISGGYMSNTQWNIANRPGKVVLTLNKLFDPEELKTADLDEMEKKINEAIYNDDFEWNKTARVKYAGNDTVAEKLEEHLYFCPKCRRELTMHGKKNVFKCENCGNGATIDEYYDLHPFDDSCVIPKNLRVWFELQRREVYRAIRDNEDFMIEEKVTLGKLPGDHYVDKTVTSEPCGEGTLRLTRSEFTYIGTKDGEPFEIHNKTVNMASVVFETDSSYFGAFFDGTYYEFKPEHPISTKWLLAVEECHRAAGGKWQNKLEHQQWIYEDDKPTDKEEYYL